MKNQSKSKKTTLSTESERLNPELISSLSVSLYIVFEQLMEYIMQFSWEGLCTAYYVPCNKGVRFTPNMAAHKVQSSLIGSSASRLSEIISK